MQQEIDELIIKEENEVFKLKKELFQLQVENGTSLPQLIDYNIKEEVVIHIGIDRFDYKISTLLTFEEFDSFIQSIITRGTTKYGYDLDGYTVWIKNDIDLKLMYHLFFSSKNPYIHILSIKKADAFKDVNLIEPNFQPNSIPFLYIPASENYLCLFLYFSDDFTFEKFQCFFQKFDPKAHVFSFVDSDGDSLKIASENDFNYFMSESLALAQNGHFIILEGQSKSINE